MAVVFHLSIPISFQITVRVMGLRVLKPYSNVSASLSTPPVWAPVNSKHVQPRVLIIPILTPISMKKWNSVKCETV
jgi:hypothetical protein